MSLATLVIAALVLKNSYSLKALSDVIQCLLLFSGAMSLIPHVALTRGRLRLFWTLIATGITFWFTYQLLWTYYEVSLRKDVPDLWAADIVMFLHIVPLMAALALRPHAPQDEYAAKLRRLDFALMMVWWGYLYVLIVIPWQYVMPDTKAYDSNLNSLYLIEKLVFLSTLVAAWMGSKGRWKTLYASLFGAGITYAASSYVANWALSRNAYYSGSLYDIPLAISMAWITAIGLFTRDLEPQAGIRTTSTSHGVKLARLGMIAAFSLPLFAAWAMLDGPIPPRIRSFRLLLTLGAALLMGIMVFVRQRLLDGELVRLLHHSRDSFSNLKRLQAQITESEKLASIGHLLGGAAHELNNPITAMLGYSDLLMGTSLTPEQNTVAGKIGQHVRRTRSLVSSLLSFAKPAAAPMSPVDLNTLLRTAVKVAQPQWKSLEIDVRAEFPQQLLLVRGDSNQLLQVCVQVINDAVQILSERGKRTLMVAARHQDGTAVIHLSDADSASALLESEYLSHSSSDAPAGLGLIACQEILRQHQGKLLWRGSEDDGLNIRVEIPVIAPASTPPSAAEIAARWQPQPFV